MPLYHKNEVQHDSLHFIFVFQGKKKMQKIKINWRIKIKIGIKI